MSGWDFCLAGLTEDTSLWLYQELMRYLLLISAMDALYGGVTAWTIVRSEVFYLPRCGYHRWCRRILLLNFMVMLGYTVPVTLLTALFHGGFYPELAAASGLFFLNGLTLVWIQALFLLLFDKIATGFFLLLLIQLASLYFSSHLTGNLKLILPGNWAMATRSTLASPDGFTTASAVIIEFILLALIWHGGWRLVRRHKRKV